MNKKELKEFLDGYYQKYKNKFSSKDPVWNLHRFEDEKDIEILGLITSCYAYGQVDQINRFIGNFLKRIDSKVYEFTSNYSERKDKKFLKDLYYRFNTADDLSLLIKNIKSIINDHKGLKSFFTSHHLSYHTNIIPALKVFADKMNKFQNEETYYSYLVPSPANNSTCKRLLLFLRWMVRKDEIDLGLWSDQISPSKLIMPVDTHVYRISRKLKLVKRKSCDLKFAIELTNKLKEFDEHDPVKYDFALCHVGVDRVFS